MQSEWRALNAGAIQDWGLEAISKSIRPALTTCPCVKTGFSTGTPSTVRPIAKRFLRCAWVEDRQHPLSSIFSVSLCTCGQTYRHLLKDGRAHHILIGSRIDRKEPRRREDIPSTLLAQVLVVSKPSRRSIVFMPCSISGEVLRISRIACRSVRIRAMVRRLVGMMFVSAFKLLESLLQPLAATHEFGQGPSAMHDVEGKEPIIALGGPALV